MSWSWQSYEDADNTISWEDAIAQYEQWEAFMSFQIAAPWGDHITDQKQRRLELANAYCYMMCEQSEFVLLSEQRAKHSCVAKPWRQALPAPSVKVGGWRGTVEDTDR